MLKNKNKNKKLSKKNIYIKNLYNDILNSFEIVFFY